MAKIRLDLEQLAVESFTTTQGERAERGTVRGHDSDPSGIGCGSFGCDSISGLERCICEAQPNTEHYSCGC